MIHTVKLIVVPSIQIATCSTVQPYVYFMNGSLIPWHIMVLKLVLLENF